MTEREIVLGGLKELRMRIVEAGLSKTRLYEIVADAIGYIEGEKPRVLSREEIAALGEGDLVWYEQVSPEGVFVSPMVANGRGEIGNGDMGVRLEYMDQCERLWTGKPPTEALMTWGRGEA